METTENQRLTWAELPDAVQNWVQETQGSAVLTAESQNSGYSLGTADRLLFVDGTRAFLKAVNEAEQSQTASLNRAEIKILQAFPKTTLTSSLIASYDQDGWVALLLEDIEGKHPETPWVEEELLKSLQALDRLTELTIDGIDKLDDLAESLGDEVFGSWQKITAQPLHRRLYKHLEGNFALDELETYFDILNERASSYSETIRKTVDLTGSSISHSDIRADNILLRNGSEAVIIDWPWACRGAGFFDSAALLANVVAEGCGFDWDAVCSASAILKSTPRETLENCIISIAGYYIWAAQIPPRSDTNSSLPAARLKRGLNMTHWLLK